MSLGEGHTEMIGVGQLVVVHQDQAHDGVIYRVQLNEGHAAVLGEELERFHLGVLPERLLQRLLRHFRWDV